MEFKVRMKPACQTEAAGLIAQNSEVIANFIEVRNKNKKSYLCFFRMMCSW
jgi:hypothetical protein